MLRIDSNPVQRGDGLWVLNVQSGNEYEHIQCVAPTKDQALSRAREIVENAQRAELHKHGIDRYLPCPAHTDKVNGECLVCKVERLRAALTDIRGSLETNWSDWGHLCEQIDAVLKETS